MYDDFMSGENVILSIYYEQYQYHYSDWATYPSGFSFDSSESILSLLDISSTLDELSVASSVNMVKQFVKSYQRYLTCDNSDVDDRNHNVYLSYPTRPGTLVHQIQKAQGTVQRYLQIQKATWFHPYLHRSPQHHLRPILNTNVVYITGSVFFFCFKLWLMHHLQ